jgi:hypothetical protein
MEKNGSIPGSEGREGERRRGERRRMGFLEVGAVRILLENERKSGMERFFIFFQKHSKT